MATVEERAAHIAQEFGATKSNKGRAIYRACIRMATEQKLIDASSIPQLYVHWLMSEEDQSTWNEYASKALMLQDTTEWKATEEKRRKEYLAYISKQLTDSLESQKKFIIDRACKAYCLETCGHQRGHCDCMSRMNIEKAIEGK